MIDAGTGDILTSFDSNPVKLFLIKQKKRKEIISFIFQINKNA